MDVDAELLNKLEAVVLELRAAPDGRRLPGPWKTAFNLFKKTDLNANHVANVIAKRSLDDLAALVGELSAQRERAGAPVVEVELPPGVDDQTLKSALKAFKKRLKLTRLDDESKINNRDPLTGGSNSKIRAIIPPFDWPKEVWETLAKQGRLRYAKNGFYELGSEPE